MRLNTILSGSAALLTLGLGAIAHAQTPPNEPYNPNQPGQPVYTQPGDPQQPGYPAQPGYPPQPGYPEQPGYLPQPYPVQPGQPGYPPPGQPMYGYPPGTQPPMYYQPPPPRRVVRYDMQPRVGLIIAGAVTLGAAYLITAGTTALFQASCDVSYSSCTNTYWPNYIPVLGPFIQMAYVPHDDFTSLARFGLAVSGLAQTGGLVMLIVGGVMKTRTPVYAQRVQIGPLMTSGGSGLALSGRF